MKAFVIAAVAGLVLTACAAKQCELPDPVEPANSTCWSEGLDCGTGIQPVE